MSLKDELVKWNNGVKYFEANDYATALDYFESIPDTSKISFNMGMALLQLGKVESAIGAFTAAIRKDAYLSVAHFQLGACRYRIKRYEDAMNDYDAALEKMRGVRLIDYTQLGLPYKLYSCYVQFNRGLCFLKLGSMDFALEDLEDALRGKPKDAKEGVDIIEQGVRLGARAADKLTVLEVPRQLLYKPPASKIENTAKVDYLGSSTVVAAIEATDNFTGFSGKRLKAATLDRLATTRGALDEGTNSTSPNIQRAATYSASRSKTIDSVRSSDRATSNSSSSNTETTVIRSKTIDIAYSNRTNGASSLPSSREMNTYEAPPQSAQPWQQNHGSRSPETEPSMFRPRKQSLAVTVDLPIAPYGTRTPSGGSHGRRPSDDTGMRRPSNDSNSGRRSSRLLDSPSDPSSAAAFGKIKLKCHYNDDTFMMLITPNTTFYHELLSRIQKKFGTSHLLRLRYQDDDGEKVLMTDQEDMELAFRSASRDPKLEIWCSNE
ncbi:hypothetical protein SeMB42_g05777 [Synchytrium endobioticum]|uniref:PB1 domain-containing protein n=1 Tax=Synchytrium endobioticum TaxID=286115 RepID=A0A507CPI7_9FUNG|nr:hypothetical protein SeMB42_g05777 [Synchytrium endobioticum]